MSSSTSVLAAWQHSSAQLFVQGDGADHGQRPLSEAYLGELAVSGQAADRCIVTIQNLERLYPRWFCLTDSLEPMSCDRELLETLVDSAPHPFLMGDLFGVLRMRLELAKISSNSVQNIEPSGRCCDLVSEMELMYPSWFAQLDVMEPAICSRDELEMMIVTAPHAFLKGMLFGMLKVRLEVSMVTGRQF